MDIRGFASVLRNRWIIILVTTAVAASSALVYSLLSLPLYQASTRFFVSTSAESVSDVYQGNLASAQRVVSYTELLTGTELAKRTVAALGLDMTPADLISEIKATSTPNTVLIDAAVTDSSPDRARDIANTIGTQFTSLVDEIETPRSGGSANATISVVEKAETPTEPVSPKTVRNVLIGLAVGLVLGLAGAITRDRLDNTVKDPKVLEELTDSVSVGLIPFDKKLKENAAIEFGQSTAAVAEAFRELKINLKFLSVDNPPRVIVITSALPGESKTTVAINLALALAESDNRVVLVEGDLRRPRVTKYLGLVGGAGVSSVLAHEATLEEVVQPSGMANVWILGSGALPPNPSELLGSNAAQNMIADLRRSFDYVVIDAPPLLPVTDAIVLTMQSDGALFVTRYGYSRKEEVARASAALETVGATMLGVVMSMAPTGGKGSAGYRYDYEPDSPTHSAAVRRPVLPSRH